MNDSGKVREDADRGLGKAHREGLTVIELFRMFLEDATVERWFDQQRWSEDRFCPDSGSANTVAVKSRKPMRYRCRDRRNHSSVRKGSVTRSGKVRLQKWVIALHMVTSGPRACPS